jgi:hypothetical protein
MAPLELNSVSLRNNLSKHSLSVVYFFTLVQLCLLFLRSSSHENHFLLGLSIGHGLNFLRHLEFLVA